MSHFSFGEASKKRCGVWLRYDSNGDLIKAVKKSGLLRLTDNVRRVVVRFANHREVRVEVWASSLVDTVLKKTRYNVFCLTLPPNPEWVCEGDLGRGLVP